MNQTPQPKSTENNLSGSGSARSRPRGIFRLWRVWLLLAVLVGVGIYFFSTVLGNAQQNTGRQTAGGGAGAGRLAPVVTAPARTGDISVYLNGLGSVTPLNTVSVKSRIDGQLMKVLFKEGQVVKQGDLLAEIDSRAYQVQLAQAEGQMAHDQALLKNAQLDLERYRKLFQQDSIAKQQLDTQDSLVRQYQGSVKIDQSQINNAKLQLNYARVTAPISGRLGLRQVDPGNIVHASDQNGLVVITQLQPISVIFTMPEDSVPQVIKKLQAGEKLTVDAYDRSQKTKLATGYILTVDNQIDTTTGTIKLKAQFPNEDFALFPNQFVNTRMLVDVKRGATVIPSAGIQRGSQGTYAYVVKEDHSVTLRPVKAGPVQGDDTAIDVGLAPGELVVVDGADKLRDGAKVEVSQKDGKAPRAMDGSGRPRDGSGRHRGGAASEKEGANP